MLPRPIKNCYWVDPGRLLAGEYPRALDETTTRERIRSLEAAGIDVFIDLTEEGELLPYDRFLDRAAHRRFPIRDVSVPASRDHTLAILDAIDGHLEEDKGVYVHCWGGVGRTGVIIGCWLARHGSPGPLALARLRELWRACPKSETRASPETAAQESYVESWREGP
jgi:predicted protein tyrosine phosphatase